MVFTAPEWAQDLYSRVPAVSDDVSLVDFMLDEKHGRYSSDNAYPPFVCGLSGKSFTVKEQKERTLSLARAFSTELGWEVNQGRELDKVLALFTYNTIDTVTVLWATHRLNGVVSPVSASSTWNELAFQLKDSGARALVTCLPLLSTALRAAEEAGIPKHHIFVCDLPGEAPASRTDNHRLKSTDQLILSGLTAPQLPPLRWSEGQATRQVAFICYSSGTSGRPKGVLVSHHNVISNVLQISAFERRDRRSKQDSRDVALGLMPQSHIYGLVIICHAAPYRGDQVIVFPRYDPKRLFESIRTYSIETLFLVPPVIVDLIKNPKKVALPSVRKVVTGAAPLGKETAEQLMTRYPSWRVCQGYGLTETATVVSWTAEWDISLGSSGSLLPGVECKLITEDEKEITRHNRRGEVLISSPSVTLGYHNSKEATENSYLESGRWFRTGDEAMIRKSQNGHDHIWITDRVKDLIKVKLEGLQVAPAELEDHLMDHPQVIDCAVIGVPDERMGEVPKAFVVLSGGRYQNELDAIIRDIHAHVNATKTAHKRLRGGIEIIDKVPRNATGKILRRQLREQQIKIRKASKF